MNRTSFYLRLAAVALVLSFGLSAYAEAPRDEVVHAFYLLKKADHDYAGHRESAMQDVEAASRELGLNLGGDLPDRERQWKSDAQLSEARRLLQAARNQLERRDRDRVADRLDKAIAEINTALSVQEVVPSVPAAPSIPAGHVETPREELAHAFYLLKKADHDYAGHRESAMREVEAASRVLGLNLGGDLPDRERQWKSDAQISEARRLLQEARNKLERQDRDRVANHLERAVQEIDEALRTK